MKKKYEMPEENREVDEVKEPLADYGIETEMTFSPPLTEEEWKDSITREELLEYIFDRIDKLPGK